MATRLASDEPVVDRGTAAGVAGALVLHLLLLAVLSLSLLARRAPVVPPPPAVEVSLVNEVGLVAAAPRPVADPAPSQASEAGPPEDAAPPDAKPAPPAPVKAPVPPAAPRQAPPEKPRETAADKPDQPRPKPITKPAAKRGSGSDLAALLPRARGSRLSDDIIAGTTDRPSTSRSTAPSAAVIDAKALAGIQDAIRRQIQPCADRQVNPGPGANAIQTVFNLRLNRDGSFAARPTVVRQSGIDDDNDRYARRVIDIGLAALSQCAPLRLPGEFYQTPNGGWNNINFIWQLR